jgi:hypothetical protein
MREASRAFLAYLAFPLRTRGHSHPFPAEQVKPVATVAHTYSAIKHNRKEYDEIESLLGYILYTKEEKEPHPHKRTYLARNQFFFLRLFCFRLGLSFDSILDKLVDFAGVLT